MTSVQRWTGRLALLLVVLTGGRPLAQGQVPQPGNADGRSAGWVFTPSISFGGGYDDNVLLANRGSEPPGDYASPLGPSASLDFNSNRTRFSSGYDGSFTFYRTLDELTSFEHYARASLSHRLTKRVTIIAEESFARAPTTDALQLAGIPFYRVGSATNTVGGGVDVALSKVMSLTSHYSWRRVNFDYDNFTGRELLGGNAHEAEVTVNRALSTRLTVSGRYSLISGALGEATNAANLVDRGNFQIHTGAGSLTYRVTPTLSVSGGAGVARMSTSVGIVPEVNEAAALEANRSDVGPTIEAGVNWRRERYQASLSYQRSFIPSFGFGGTFQNQEWVANLHVPFARNRAYADGSFAWFDNESLFELQPTLKTMWISGKVGYRVTPWFSVEGYYGRSQQDAQIAGGNLDRNQVGFRVVAAKPIRLR